MEQQRECFAEWTLSVRPDDLNPHLTLFGGQAMSLADQIANQAAERFAGGPVITANFDSIDFKAPIHAYDRIHLRARGTRTFETSMEVMVNVNGIDPRTGRSWRTSDALLTLVHLGESGRPAPFPPLGKPTDPGLLKLWQGAGERRQLRLSIPREVPPDFDAHHAGNASHLSFESGTDMVFPRDCNELGMVRAGHVLAISDRLAAISAARHSRRPVVTASLDYVRFLQPIEVGQLLIVRSYLTHAFKTSMEVKVEVWKREQAHTEPARVTTAYLTMVALGEDDHPVDVPELELKTDLDRRLWRDAGERRKLRSQIEATEDDQPSTS